MVEERKLVTILFADVTGSTALGEALDAEDVRALMARYFEHARRVVAEHGGTVEKFIGDAVMAVFGLTQAHGDDAERALAAALALRDLVAGDAVLDGRFVLRMGVHTGQVIATDDHARGDFLVTGDAVNVAARLEQHAQPGEIVASRRTADAARAAFLFGRRRLVTAKGKKIRASQNENPDLFWAIRGGGGNFGVVTQFEFQLFPVGPEIVAGLLVFPFNQAKQILIKYRQLVNSVPEDLNVWAVLRKAPPLPFLPQTVHGTEVVVLPVFYTGTVAQAEKLIAPVRAFGTVLGEHIGPQPYVQWEKAFDPLLTPGARNYWKSHNFTELADGALDSIVEFAGKLPSPQCEIFIGLIAGAPNRIAPDAMAYGHRDAKFVLNVHGRWDEAKDDRKCIDWARDFFKASAPYASAGAYVNFMTAEESDRIASAYGANYARLVEVKRKYDPDNVFHLNQNIKP